MYIDDGVDLEVVANRVMWGKCTNAGQTCIAPDYIMCTKQTQVTWLAHQFVLTMLFAEEKIVRIFEKKHQYQFG